MFLFSENTLSQQNNSYKQISNTTYEVPIADIRKANLIFVEHQSYVQNFAEMQIQATKMINQIDLLTKNNVDLQKNNDDYKTIIETKNSQIQANDTYYTTKIKSVKKQRNGAYVVALAATVVSILLLTK